VLAAEVPFIIGSHLGCLFGPTLLSWSATEAAALSGSLIGSVNSEPAPFLS